MTFEEYERRYRDEPEERAVAYDLAADREPASPDTARWLDGPKLVAWLLPRVAYSRLHPHRQRRMRDWNRPGARATVWLADKVLTEHGYHLSELPDDLWCDDAPQHTRERLRAAS